MAEDAALVDWIDFDSFIDSGQAKRRTRQKVADNCLTMAVCEQGVRLKSCKPRRNVQGSSPRWAGSRERDWFVGVEHQAFLLYLMSGLQS